VRQSLPIARSGVYPDDRKLCSRTAPFIQTITWLSNQPFAVI
jgi:hypothetical protein